MKTKNLHLLGILVLSGCLLSGCHSDIDLDHVDTAAEVSMGLVLPVGSIKADIGNFLNVDSIPELYYDTLDGEGVLTFRKSFEVTKSYHQVDLSEHLSQGDFDLKMYNKIADMGIIQPDGYVYGVPDPETGKAKSITINFPMTLTLNGINDDTSDERLDSAHIENSRFVSKISQRNMDDLLWKWVDSIVLDLGPRFERPEGNKIIIYDKASMYSFVSDYQQELLNDVDHFTLCMMDNRNLNKSQWSLYKNNVFKDCTFDVYLTLTIPVGERVYVDRDAAFTYNLGIQFIDYTAIWGMFAPSGNMVDGEETDFSQTWDNIPLFSNAALPFSDPSIDVDIVTKVAGAFVLTGDYLYTVDKDSLKHYAQFNNHREFEKDFAPGEYLDPYTSTIGDSTTNMHVQFDKQPANGELNKLFEKTPYRLGYKFGFKFNEKETPQIRITPTTGVHLTAKINLPMAFDEGLELAYTDTVRDISLSQFSLDSLLNQNGPVVFDSLKSTTNVNLLVKAESTIPFRVKAVLRFLDDNGDVLTDSLTGEELILFEGDTILVEPPHFTKVGEQWQAEPKESLVTAALTKSALDQLPKTKAIRYSLLVDNESMEYAYQAGNFSVKITADESVKFTIGLTAQLDAVLHFNTNNNK